MTYYHDTKPSLLSQSNIPKPLHGLNPRTIMGQAKWDEFRQGVYASTKYHCKACGVHKLNAKKHQWLEAHEDFEIDYKNQSMTLRTIVPLCHYCHRFIHSGLLYKQLDKGEITAGFIVDVLEHGFKVLSDNKLQCFPFTKELANVLGANSYNVMPFEISASGLGDWAKWKIIWNGIEYNAKFKSETQWLAHYS